MMPEKSWRRVAAGLVLFGISFAYVEAAVVVYLRAMYDPVRLKLRPNQPVGDLFPLIPSEQLQNAAPESSWFRSVEAGREMATMIMLASVALAAAGGRSLWLPSFAIAFGTWDLFFYVFLKLLVNWPASLMTWDILFIVPVPWSAPVLALARPMRMLPAHWGAMTLGVVLILMSFMWDYRNVMAGGFPRPFAWSLFGAGEIAGIAAFFHAWNTLSGVELARDSRV
jgi:hypothetical protein